MTKEERFFQNQKLIFYVIKKIKGFDEDIISIGKVGLWKAVVSFEDKADAKFSTYAVRCIKNEIFNYLRNEKRIKIYEIDIEILPEIKVNFLNHKESRYDFYLQQLSKQELAFFKDIANFSQKNLAKKYGVSQSTISIRFQILKNKLLSLKAESDRSHL